MVNIIPTKCEEKTEDYLLGVGIPACWLDIAGKPQTTAEPDMLHVNVILCIWGICL